MGISISGDFRGQYTYFRGHLYLARCGRRSQKPFSYTPRICLNLADDAAILPSLPLFFAMARRRILLEKCRPVRSARKAAEMLGQEGCDGG